MTVAVGDSNSIGINLKFVYFNDSVLVLIFSLASLVLLYNILITTFLFILSLCHSSINAGITSKEEQELSLRNKLQQIARTVLSNAGFDIRIDVNSLRHNKIFVSYWREKSEGVSELNGSVEGELNGRSFNLERMTFDYTVKSEMNYFAGTERHRYQCFTGGERITELKLRKAFQRYLCNIVLGHREFFERIN